MSTRAFRPSRHSFCGLKLSLKPSKRTPCWQALTGKLWSTTFERPAWADHGELWIDAVAHGRGKPPRAFVSHPYDLSADDHEELDSLASEHGLSVYVHPPGKSWYHPTAWLVVLVRPVTDPSAAS